jgi:prefoldin subunit 5
MTENIDLLSKQCALKGIEASINIYMKRIETLAAEYAALGTEIEAAEGMQGENKPCD